MARLTLTCCALLALLALGCPDQHSNRLRDVSISSANARYTNVSTKPIYAPDGYTFYTVKATLPDQIKPDSTWKKPVLVDNESWEHEFIQSSLTHGTKSPTVFSAMFLVQENRSPHIVRIGRYDLDFTRSTIVDRTAQ